MKKVTGEFDKQLDEQLKTLQTVMPDLSVAKKTSRKAMAKDSKAAYMAKQTETAAEPVYAQVNKPSRAGAGYENVDALTDDSGLGQDYRGDDFSDASGLSQDDQDDDFYGFDGTTVDTVSQGVLEYFHNGRESLDTVFRTDEVGDEEKSQYLERLVSDLEGKLIESGFITGQKEARDAASGLVSIDGRDLASIKQILSDAVNAQSSTGARNNISGSSPFMDIELD